MKTALKYILGGLIVGSTFLSCDVDKYNLDPNRPTIVEPQAILPNVIFQSFKNRYPWQPGLTMRHNTAISDRQAFQTYEWSTGSWDEFNILRDVQKVMTATSATEADKAIAHILRAYNFFFLTRMYGDIPYTQALAGEQAGAPVYTPAYDTQKEVLLGILSELETANSILAQTPSRVNGDILYQGDLKKWQKFANSFSLKVLLSCSNQQSDTDLAVADRFKKIVSNPAQYPVFASAEDEVKVAYSDYELIRYPMYQDFNVQNKRFLGKDLTNLMKTLQDPRLFFYGQPSQNALEQGLTAQDFNAYQGIDGSLSMPKATELASTGDYSRIHVTNYTTSPVGKPSLAFSYTEFMLLLQEAQLRGWFSGTASYYDHAITASFAHYGIQEQANSYLQLNALSTDTETALQQVYAQRYILFYHQGDFEPLFEYHRTGYPKLSFGEGQATSSMPYRMMYPLSEQNTNTDHYQQALARQGMKTDNIMHKLWIYN
ncbi:SusD/RagB family nutrient-binding outer membrane lipoprotein [Sphingobacterium yanglingense]|uniref:SusD-like starch-binding protein associating with outer membrane n=1 Tax=Sphingobacterium yanglingense TaxID=1437280 RepID=A0A4V3DE20_9SPHI|nr:SusD/RagB family nutrient-binding outer membrane lipoprotein [Sphingobacterium yanglingense]TDQ79339.1 SusD-like starch-binding protein associating with outer membrane [Sphingobacterium yanglingense]